MPTVPSFLKFSPSRIRSLRTYIYRLPLFTRLTLLLIFLFWTLAHFLPWFQAWASLIPSAINIGTMYRLNTYPFLHLSILHALFNILALTPLMERFEAENGTLVTGAMFAGPFATLPAGLYILIERFLFRGDTPIEGASIWVFLLLSAEAIKQSRSNPHFSLGPYKIPTWTYPIAVVLCTSFLIPNTSLTGHLCGTAVGYLFGLGYLKFLVPPERVLRYIEGKLNLLARLPHYVSVDQKTYGRYGVLPSSNSSTRVSADGAAPAAYIGSSERLGP